MTKTMRIMMFLLLTMVGAGQASARLRGDCIKLGTISGGSVAFYADEACTTSFDGDVAANATVYVKATPEPGKTAIGVTFTVKKSISSDAMQAPGRRSAPEGPGITSDITVSAVTGKPGIYCFTMPAEGNTNVTVSATFAAPAQQQVSYIDESGASQTVNAYVFDETMRGLSTGFYIVPDGGFTFNYDLTIGSDASLILRDGAALTVNGTIEASDNHSLTIYAQTAMTGQLTVTNYACHVILVPHFMAYSGDDATAFIAAGTVSDANKTTINGKTLKPLVGNAFTKYVPQDKSGSYTMALPALPNDASYTFTKNDASDVINTISDGGAVTELTFTTNSGKTGGTTATITVAATGTTNNNDYSFTLNVVVSDYTTAYAWSKQTSIWLDADNELVWAEGGNTLDTSLLTVKKNGASVTNYTAKVGETVLGFGENLLTLEPGAYRINIIGDDGKLDDWVDFKVIKLIEDGQDFSVTFDDLTLPVRTESGYESGLVRVVGEVKYGEYDRTFQCSEVVAGDPIVDGNLKVWFDFKDRFSGMPSFSKWVQLDSIYNFKEQYRRNFTRFGDIVPVGNNHSVYMPEGMSFNVLYDADGEPVPADADGGKIYYVSGYHPNLHTEPEETVVNGEPVTAWVLYDGDTKVEDGYYFRDRNDIYYGDGVNKFKNVSSRGSDELLTLYPIYIFEQGAIVLDKEGRWRDGEGIVQGITGYGAFGWNSTEGCAIVGGDYIYIGSLIYLGYAYPGVKPTIDGSIIRIGDEYYDVGKDSPIAYLPNDSIGQFNPPLTLNGWSYAYAKYRVDDYTYQVASREFIIYPNNSLIEVRNNKNTYNVGEEIEFEFTVRSLRDGGLYVFLNGDLYHHFKNVGSDELINSVTLTLNDLSAGEYTITAISDCDHYVTGYQTQIPFTVVKTDPVLTLTGKQNTAGEAFEAGANIEYDPENPIVVNAVNDKAVSGTNWKWTISNTDVVTQHHIVNESQQNAVNSEDVYLNTVGLGEVTLTARFSGDYKYNRGTKDITFTVVPKNVTSPIIKLVSDATIYYDGTAKEPEVKVYYAEGKEIPANQYTVTYQNNTDASTESSKAKIIVNSVDGALYTITNAQKEFYIQETAVTITELPVASIISDGKTLAASTLTGGKAKAGELDIEGTFTWKDATIAPTVANSNVTEYDVTFTPDNRNYKLGECKVKLTVMPRAMLFADNTANLWATFCGEHEYEVPEGCTAYTISGISGSTVTISEITATEQDAPAIIPAYTPLLIQRSENVTTPVKATFSAIGTVPASGYNAQTGLAWIDGSNFAFYGNATDAAITANAASCTTEGGFIYVGRNATDPVSYVLRNGQFILVDENQGLAAHRCVLNVETESSNAPAKLAISKDGEATGMSLTPTLSEGEGAWYTLDGRKLNGKPTKKGIYVNGGRKVVVK